MGKSKAFTNHDLPSPESQEQEEHEWRNGSGRGGRREYKGLENLVPVGATNLD
jgi:hypothetical protein